MRRKKIGKRAERKGEGRRKSRSLLHRASAVGEDQPIRSRRVKRVNKRGELEKRGLETKNAATGA